ncbi:uncharacterized protein RSE6_06014 [Rhynchosporium secalis]|uniref:Uncharacterized protein n=1 Tax=Rhynchosporium secalis TaxID=38038 RepID=A0A1E1M9A3_RHYSE|nr:uncharacterized protein RSE6_06014 [Rhynchosporium secalis]
MVLPRTTLLQSASKINTSYPQAVQTSEPWSFTTSLPISYRVAIFLDAFILFLTLAILVGALLYLRNRGPTPYMLSRQRNHNLSPDPKARSRGAGRGMDEEQTLLIVGYSDERPKKEMGELVKASEDKIVVGIVKGLGGKKKKGHVRWTPSVQGGEAFGIPDNYNGKGKGKEDVLNCNCGGVMHAACGRYEVKSGSRKEVGGERKDGASRSKGY